MDKGDVVHIYGRIYSVMRKKEILPFVTMWMKLEGIMFSEISQTVKDTAW